MMNLRPGKKIEPCPNFLGGVCTTNLNSMISEMSPSIQSFFSNIPSLRLRKDIWTHFPVCLIKLPYSHDGRDRYAVQWHQKNLEAWGQHIPQYTSIAQIRLIKALAASEKWSLERPQKPGDLCVIAMNFSEQPREFEHLPAMSVGTISSIEDLKDAFPVCWKTHKNRHTLEFHNTMVRAMATVRGVDELVIRNEVLSQMLPALEKSGWVIESKKANSSEICTIHK